LFSFPFLSALREKYRRVHITCVVVPRYSELLMDSDLVDEVIVLSDRNGILAVPEKIGLIFRLRKEKYDTCFLLKPSRSKASLARSAGISDLVGFKGKGPLTIEVDIPEKKIHRADTILLLAEAFGAEVSGRKYKYTVPEEARKLAEELIKKKGQGKKCLVGIHPGGNWAEKRWKKDNFVRLIKDVLSADENTEVIITGGKKDVSLAKDTAHEVKSPRCYTVAGETSLNGLAAVFEKCKVVISADSGPLHLASATGTRTIGLFGPTSPEITGQIGTSDNLVISTKDRIECEVPCYTESCQKNNICMELIDVDEVSSAVKEMIIEKHEDR